MIGTSQQVIQWLFEQDNHESIYEIKERKQRRSLTQNSYYWELLNQLAKRLATSNDELHKELLKRYAPCTSITLLSTISPSSYFNYYEKIKDNGKFTAYKIFKGSSQMDSGEFKRLLDGLISECEQMGIPTLTDDVIETLKRG